MRRRNSFGSEAVSKGTFDRRENRRNAAARKGYPPKIAKRFEGSRKAERDGAVELVAKAEVGYPLTSLDEIRIKRPSLEPLRRRLKAIEMRRSKRDRACAGQPRRPKVERTSEAKWPQGAASICMA